MKLFNSVLEALRYNKTRRLKGDYISIPWYKLPNLSKYLPGIMQSHYTIVTANQKVEYCPL